MQNINTKLIINIFAALLLAVVGYFAYTQINYKNVQIKKALSYLKEFRTAKALEILQKAQSKSKKKDDDLSFLILYTHSKSSQFDISSEQVKSLKFIARKHTERFLELINLLNSNDQIDLIVSLVKKAPKIDLDQQYFINLSKQRNSIDEELKILETGVQYLNKKFKKKKNIEKYSHDIEIYLLKRYLEIANIYQGNQKFDNALKYLLKAEKLKAFKTSPFKDELYLNMGLTYKGLEKFTEAWSNIRKSANLGNARAKSMIDELKHRYIPY